MSTSTAQEYGVSNGWIGGDALFSRSPSAVPAASWNAAGASNGSCGSNESTPRKNGRFFLRSSSRLMPAAHHARGGVLALAVAVEAVPADLDRSRPTSTVSDSAGSRYFSIALRGAGRLKGLFRKR